MQKRLILAIAYIGDAVVKRLAAVGAACREAGIGGFGRYHHSSVGFRLVNCTRDPRMTSSISRAARR